MSPSIPAFRPGRPAGSTLERGGWSARRVAVVLARGAALCATAALAACGRAWDGGASADSATGAARAAAAAPSVPATPECPNTTGRWDECNVRQRLERAGLAPARLPGEQRLPFMAVPALRYRVGHDTLAVFIYRDAAALGRDLARLDTARVQPRDTTVAWSATPTLMTSNNLVAILLSDRPTQIERVRLALTAGLPAPDGKR
jgi:hypothetical protein